MSKTLRIKLNALLIALAKCFGSTIWDVHTGEKLGKGFIFAWGGHVYLIGYEGKPVYPVFVAQERLTYWRQRLGFASHPEPDFLHVRSR